MAERRAGTKSRRLGSSRRKQLREGSEEAPATAPSPGEEPPCPPEIVQRVQDFFRERDKGQEGFVTRSDMQKLQEEGFPCSMEELELVFNGLDAAGTGRLSTEEFTAGLWQFLSSQKASRDHRRRKTASRRVRLVIPSPVLEGVESEERRHFAAFVEQLGTDNVSEEQEIWQLWVKLRQDEPQLLGNLEDFLAKMRHLVQEAKSKKEALEVTLNKRVAEHDKEVQQLCESLKQQIQQEQEQLEQESMARSQQRSVELQRALDAGKREVQRLVRAQQELETRCRSLHSTQQATSTEDQQLEDHLQHLHQQLQQTHRHLQTARAVVAWEHMEESRDGAMAELPSETLVSPQMSLDNSKKNISGMWNRLGSQSNEPKAKSTHQVVWEMLPAGTSLSGALPRASSTEEDSFPEFLKEEPFSDQSSLLREMNEAIAALSKQLKPQAPKTPPTPADTAHHPQEDAEPHTGPEADTAPGTSLEVLQETVPGHGGHELLEGDLKEGPVTDELCAPEMSQAGGSVGAGHGRAQKLGAEQGESPEEAQRMLFLQGTGAGVKELMLKVAEDLQGAPGESMEAGEQVLVEVEAEGWMQEKTGWEKARPPGGAEEAASSQGENLVAGLGPPEAGDAGRGGGQQLALDELGLAAAPGDPTQPLGVGLGKEADPPSGLPEELEIKPGERPEPEPPPRAEVQMGAAQGDDVLPEVAVAVGHGLQDEERVGVEVQPQGETSDAVVPPARRGGSSRAEEGGTEVTQPREAELQGESARGDAAAWAETAGAEGTLLAPWAVPPADGQEGGVGADVQPLEAQSSGANLQLLPEEEAALQPPSEARSPGVEQGGSVVPDAQLLEEDDKPELGLGEEMGAAAVQGQGPSSAETPAGSPGLGGLFPVKAQALEMVEAADAQTDTELWGELSPEVPQGGEGVAATELKEEAEDGTEGQGEHELLQEPVIDLQGAGFGQGEGAGAGAQPPEKAEIQDMLQDLSTDTNMQLLAETDEPLPEVEGLKLTPGGSTETHLKLSSEARSPDLMREARVAPDVQPLDQSNKSALVELEAGGSWADTQLRGVASPEKPQGEGDCAAVQLREEAEDGAQGQGERELPHEPVLDLERAGFGQGEADGVGVQPWEEAEVLDTLQGQSTDANVQLLAETDELKLTPAGCTEADVQLLSEGSSLDTEQGESVAPNVQPQAQVNQLELVELEAGGSWADTQLRGVASPETLWGVEGEAAVRLKEEAEDGAQGQGEHELPHEPMLDLERAGFGQGEADEAEVQPPEEAEILDMLQDLSTDTNVQLLAVMEELKLTPSGSTETDLKVSSKPGSLDTEEAGSVSPDVQLLDQVNKPELVEMVEAGGSWADTWLCEGPSLETSQGEGDCAAVQLKEEAETGAQGQDESELLQEPVINLQGAGFGQGEGGGAQAPELEAGASWADTQLHGVASPETLQGQENGAAMWLKEEAEDGAQGQGECELPLEPVLDLEGAGFGQGEGTGAGTQTPEEAEIQDMLQDLSTDTNMQLLAETDEPLPEVEELRLVPGGSTETHLKLSSEARSPDLMQGARVAPDVQPLDQSNKSALVELEAGGSWADTQLRGVASPEKPQGEGDCAAVQLREEAEDGAQGQGERELPHEPVLDLEGAGFGQGEADGVGVQPWEEAEVLDTLQGQSIDANVQLLAETDELKLTPAGCTEADVQLLSEGSSLDTEQGESVAPNVQPQAQVNQLELVELEAGGSWADTQLRGVASPETLWGVEGEAAVRLKEEAEDGAQGQGERELLQEPVLHPPGVAIRQGEGVGAEVQPPEEAEILDMLQGQSSDTKVQLLAEADELKLTPGGITEADLSPLGAAGMQEGEQSQALGSEAVLCAAHTSDTWRGCTGAHVSIPAEATLHLELATAIESPGPEAKLGAFTGSAGQILEDTQTLETAQHERVAAEERPWDGAQDLEGAWGERLEAGLRSLVETQSPGMKQGQDDGVSVLASLLSEVTLQTSTLKLETVMQEDVLVPDVCRIGASGQAAQSDLQEQVSAQADKMRLHTASQQLEKPPRVVEAEQVAARPPEHPKQEVPPASTRRTIVQQEEDAENDLSGMVLRDSSLGHAANSSMQPHGQLLGAQSEDLNVDQQQKQQEAGEKTNQEGEPSPGQPEAVTTDGVESSPRGSPEASLEPDHLYNVLFVGDSHVGKTSFLFRLHTDTFNPNLTATLGLDYQTKNLIVDNRCFVLHLWDSAGQERYHSITKQFFRKADGVVLMYDITSGYSFSDVRYWLSCIQEGAEDGVVVLLLGNKTDRAAERQVPTMEGERLAKEHQLMFYECSAASGHNVFESMVSLVRLLKVHEDELKTKAAEVPKPPQKKKGCC